MSPVPVGAAGNIRIAVEERCSRACAERRICSAEEDVIQAVQHGGQDGGAAGVGHVL